MATYMIPVALIVLGGALGLAWIRRTGQQIEPGVWARVLASVVLLAVAFALSQLEGIWLGLLVLALALGSIGLGRALIPEARVTRWHWPSVIFAFVVVPIAVFALWALLAA